MRRTGIRSNAQCVVQASGSFFSGPQCTAIRADQERRSAKTGAAWAPECFEGEGRTDRFFPSGMSTQEPHPLEPECAAARVRASTAGLPCKGGEQCPSTAISTAALGPATHSTSPWAESPADTKIPAAPTREQKTFPALDSNPVILLILGICQSFQRDSGLYSTFFEGFKSAFRRVGTMTTERKTLCFC